VRATRVIAGTIVGGLLGGALALAAAASAEPTYRASAQVEFVQAPGTVPLSDAARDARIDGFVETARSLTAANGISLNRSLGAADRVRRVQGVDQQQPHAAAARSNSISAHAAASTLAESAQR